MSCWGLEGRAERAVGLRSESAQEVEDGQELTVGASGVGAAGVGRLHASVGPGGASLASCRAAPPAASTL